MQVCEPNVKIYYLFYVQDYLDLSLRQALKSYQRMKHFAFCRYEHRHIFLYLLGVVHTAIYLVCEDLP